MCIRDSRPYKEPWPLQDALDELARERGRHFDPRVLDAFMGMVGDLDPLLLAAHEAADTVGPVATAGLID